MRPSKVVDVDFSLAIHNRTGKYFIGRDIISDNSALIGKVFFGRLSGKRPPPFLPGRLAARALGWELARRSKGLSAPPRVRRTSPVLHLDPMTALNYECSDRDIILVHDIGPVTHPALFAPEVGNVYTAAYRYIEACRCSVVFVSEYSRREFLALYPGAGKSVVIYPQLRKELKADGSPPATLVGPFILTVGSVGVRKGQLSSIQAFSHSGLADVGVQYVLCGGPEEPGFAEVVSLARRTKGVVHLPYSSDAELSWLYSNASGFVLASKLEGFGVPVAEAISYGLVPAVSQNSVLEEVAGEGCLTFDPFDNQQIADSMRLLVNMSAAEKERRLSKMRLRLKDFSREKFAEKWFTLLDSAAQRASMLSA